MGGAVVCLSCRFARLGSRSAVGEGHAVRGAIGLAVVAVLVVDHALLGLAALHLAIVNRDKSNAVSHTVQAAANYEGRGGLIHQTS